MRRAYATGGGHHEGADSHTDAQRRTADEEALFGVEANGFAVTFLRSARHCELDEAQDGWLPGGID